MIHRFRTKMSKPALQRADIVTVPNLEHALEWLNHHPCGAALVSSASSAGACGEMELAELHRRKANLPVIIHCQNGSVDDVIRLTRLGAFYVLLGEIECDLLKVAVNTAIEKSRPNFHPDLETLPWRKFLIGHSAAMLQIYEIVQLIAPKRVTVLISGETGTGKEVIAKAIHAASNRSALPMVSVNCTALPANLIETELFGHAKGAFTGAHAARVRPF